ncbi:MAG: T9SS type A sorting domain-containing protein [Bacteroidota bacterium]|nr:T9SS type A sorting domain-containing protein [Bacteroidota bacterium]
MKNIYSILLLAFILVSFKANSLPSLSSFPKAKATIFLDFDGHYVQASSWNGGVPFYCVPSGLNDEQITEVFNRVAEDYRPFNINITTDSTVFLAAPLTQRIRIIVTLTSGWYLGVGGVSYTGSFTWGDDTPGFVFPNRLSFKPKNIAECCSHESGHTVGLSHQAKYNSSCNLLTVYNDGAGTGEASWAPVMGNSYGRNLSGWNNGPTPNGCTADQDNLSIITSKNGFSYRDDDHSDDPNVNPTVLNIIDSQFYADGIITTNTDKDAFKINLPEKGKIQLRAKPFSVGQNNEGADLDVQVTLLNSSMQVLQVYNPEDKLDVSIDTTLPAGDYYLVLQGAGNANTTNYGSLGSYTISGLFSPLIIESVTQVLLSGQTDKDKDILNWNVISNETIKTLALESSSNGIDFSTLSIFSSEAKHFNYVPLVNENIFYRIKIISVNGEIVYSNIISLKAEPNCGKRFTISALVQSEIKVNATENYHYQMADLSGRVLKSGSNKAGANTININNCPDGIYFLQIISNSQITTQRIIKL